MICYCHICATYKYALKCLKFQLAHAQMSDNYVSIYSSHQLTTDNNVTHHWCTYINIIGISPWTNMSVTSHKYALLHEWCSVYADTPLLSIPIQKQQIATVIFHAISMYVATTNMPLKCHIYQWVEVQIWDYYSSIYNSYELNAISNVTRSTGIHIFHITGMCPWTNMPTTLHKYVPLHFCSLQIDPTVLHTSIKKQ